jgi:hypothetical protein
LSADRHLRKGSEILFSGFATVKIFFRNCFENGENTANQQIRLAGKSLAIHASLTRLTFPQKVLPFLFDRGAYMLLSCH